MDNVHVPLETIAFHYSNGAMVLPIVKMEVMNLTANVKIDWNPVEYAMDILIVSMVMMNTDVLVKSLKSNFSKSSLDRKKISFLSFT